MQLKLYWMILGLVLICLATRPAAGNDMEWESIGLRVGMNNNRNNLNFARYFTLGYRLQHMSNCVFYKHNPGLNMHMIEADYRF